MTNFTHHWLYLGQPLDESALHGTPELSVVLDLVSAAYLHLPSPIFDPLSRGSMTEECITYMWSLRNSARRITALPWKYAPGEFTCLVTQWDSIFPPKLPKQSMAHHIQILAREYLLTRTVVDLRRSGYGQVEFHPDATWNSAAHRWESPTEAQGSSGSLLLQGEDQTSTIPFLQQTLCAICHLGYVSAFRVDLQGVFSDYITSEKASGPSSIHQRQGWRLAGFASFNFGKTLLGWLNLPDS